MFRFNAMIVLFAFGVFCNDNTVNGEGGKNLQLD